MGPDLVTLERNVKFLKVYSLIMTSAILVLLFVAFSPRNNDLIRTKGIVIEDEKGRARIVLGMPAPRVADRVRTDSIFGLAILDEKGRDRLTLGSPKPDPQYQGGRVGKRVNPATGLQLNDLDGNERAGLSVQDNGNVVLGLDYETGGEAVVLAVAKNMGLAGMLINAYPGDSGNQRVFAGTIIGEKAPGLFSLSDTAGKKILSLPKGF